MTDNRTDSGKRTTRDDLDECWCCGGLHDAVGTLCPDCDAAGCKHFGGECQSDHKPVVTDGGQEGRRTEHEGTFLDAVAADHDKPCPFPGCGASCRTDTERRRHLQKEHNLSYDAAMDYLEGKGLEEREIDAE